MGKINPRSAGSGIFVLGLALVLIVGCALFNHSPVARITASPLTGQSPLSVNLDASDSSDPDDDPLSYEWDFGDGSDTAVGEIVDHVFTATDETTIYTVTLTVTDGRGGRSTTSQSIEVTPGPAGETGGEGFPVARFTADRIIGLSPLTVSFDAADSTPGTGYIVECDWDFGDDGKGIGTQLTHTFEPEETATFTVTLFVWNSEGDVDTEQMEIIVIVPDPQTGDEEPVAEIEVIETLETYQSTDKPAIPSLFSVTLSPAGSYADAGHTIEYYAWEFGDGDMIVNTTDEDVTHIYELRPPTHTYVARLTVYDDQGLEGSTVVNITLTDE